MESEPMLTPREIKSFYRNLRGESNPWRCITQDSESRTLPTELSRPRRVHITWPAWWWQQWNTGQWRLTPHVTFLELHWTVTCRVNWSLYPHQPAPVVKTTEHVLQRCLLHKVTREDVWPARTFLAIKLYGCKQELQKTTSFISWAAPVV